MSVSNTFIAVPSPDMTRGPVDVYDDAAVNAWIQDDPDPVTRAELTELLAAATALMVSSPTRLRQLSQTPSAARSPLVPQVYAVASAVVPTG